MKKILIAILVLILLIFAYSQYKEYKRFHPNNSDYKANEKADLDYHDQSMVYNYHDAIEALNSFVSMQWSANGIDVKFPENDDRESQSAIREYGKKLAKVKYYEAKLKQSKRLKEEGFSNDDVKNYEVEGLTLENHNNNLKAKVIKEMFSRNVSKNGLQIGNTGALVFEIQKRLVSKGYNIEVDGVFHLETFEAIKAFEEKNNLFADGILDELTLNRLMH